jgi:hypothetical protein
MLLAAATLFAVPVWANAAAGAREVVVVNHAEQPINEIYVSPHSSDQWGRDWLGADTLDPGGSIRLRLGWSGECRFDVKIVYGDASREERQGVDLCREREIVFDGSAATPPPGSEQEHQVLVENRSALPIQQLFISPSAASQWGDDRITTSSISAGGERVIPWRGDCTADVRVVFANRAAEERRTLDLCTLPALVIAPGWTTAPLTPEPKPAARP